MALPAPSGQWLLFLWLLPLVLASAFGEWPSMALAAASMAAAMDCPLPWIHGCCSMSNGRAFKDSVVALAVVKANHQLLKSIA